MWPAGKYKSEMPKNSTTSKNGLLAVLSSPIAYYVTFAKIAGSVAAGVMLSQLVYWTGKGNNPDGWIWKTATEMEEETGLTRREQETARRRLRERGFVEERLAGVPATLHYRVNLDAVMEAAAQFGEKRQPSLAESANPVSTKAPNWIGGKRQTNTENTTEITTETTSDDANNQDFDSVSYRAPSEKTDDENQPSPDERCKPSDPAAPSGAGGSAAQPHEIPPEPKPESKSAQKPKPKTDSMLLPQTLEERVLFGQLQEAARAAGRRGPQRFQTPQQAEAFREAAAHLNGRTEAIIKAAVVRGITTLAGVVSYVAGAARNVRAESAGETYGGVPVMRPVQIQIQED